MGAVDPNYKTPGVSFTSVSSQAIGGGPGVQGTLCLLGTAPKGSNLPQLVNNLGAAQLQYGTAVDAATPGQSGGTFNLEPGLEIAFAQAGVGQGLQVQAIRVGATLGSVNILNGSGGTAYGLTANPNYAGVNTITAIVSASSYSTPFGSYQQAVSLYNVPLGSNPTVIETYHGYTPQQINDAINTASALATCVTSGGAGTVQNSFGVSGTYTLTGALDGSAAQPADYVNALNNVAINIDADFVVALSGDSTVQQGVYNHCLQMALQNSPREGIVGFKYLGQPVPLVVNQAQQAQSPIVTPQMMLLANTGAYRRNPVTGLNTIYDGFYLCAAIGAIKAANNPAEPLTRKSLAGILSLVEEFGQANLDLLASQGILALSDLPQPVKVYDGVDLDNPGNYRQENITAAQNRLIKILLSYANPLIGTASPTSNIQSIQQAVINGLSNAAQKQIIRGYDPTQVSVVAQSIPGRYTVNLSYQPRIEILRIDYFLTLNLGQ